MKRSFVALTSFIVVLLLNTSSILFAQSNANVSWPLNSVSKTSPKIIGKISAADESFSNMVITDYNGVSGSQRITVKGGNWTNDNSPNYSRYVQFSLKPDSGNIFSISSIALNLGGSGGSNMQAVVLFSTDSNFTKSTEIFSGALGRDNLNLINYDSSIIIGQTQTIYLRIFPWYTNSATGKYLNLSDIVIAGNTGMPGYPVIMTLSVSKILKNSAVCKANALSDGGTQILSRGFCWNTSGSPSISGDSTVDGNGLGNFVSKLNNLASGTIYYVRSYATNSTGTTYGNEINFTTLASDTTFTVSASTKGKGTINVQPQKVSYEPGSRIVVNAIADSGYTFVKWSGDIAGLQNPDTLTLYDNMNFSADFISNKFKESDSVPIGFASVNAEGQSVTTGGSGGDTVLFKDYYSLASYCLSLGNPKGNKNIKPQVIFVTSMQGDGNQILIKAVSNVTILGAFSGATIVNGGFQITNSKNIIIRNIELKDCKPDCITINTTSSYSTHHIWIDHCTFTDSPSVDPGASTHDGLLDITHRSNYVTVSWNHFSNHRKTCLLGYTDGASDEQGQLKTTYHHNWFEGTFSRHPRVRHTECHVFNNFYDGRKPLGNYTMDYGIASTDGAKVLVEGCYFLKVKNPTKTQEGNSPNGDLLQRDNIFVDCGTHFSDSTAFNPLNYYKYSMDSASAVPNLVESGAGAGVLYFEVPRRLLTGINNVEAQIPSEFSLFQNYPNPFNPSTIIKYTIPQKSHVILNVYDILGRRVTTLVNRIESPGMYRVNFNAANLSNGIYFYSLKTDVFNVTRKMILLK